MKSQHTHTSKTVNGLCLCSNNTLKLMFLVNLHFISPNLCTHLDLSHHEAVRHICMIYGIWYMVLRDPFLLAWSLCCPNCPVKIAFVFHGSVCDECSAITASAFCFSLHSTMCFSCLSAYSGSAMYCRSFDRCQCESRATPQLRLLLLSLLLSTSQAQQFSHRINDTLGRMARCLHTTLSTISGHSRASLC